MLVLMFVVTMIVIMEGWDFIKKITIEKRYWHNVTRFLIPFMKQTEISNI